MAVETEFSANMDKGDYSDTEEFRLFNGATDFQGLGAGFDAYSNLRNILPANHPVLRNRVVLGVDPSNAMNDILMA
eukprot:CAMPEP_0196733158 /NCGR_PEP_ID=MMETSP1091-20130531/12339_1 /TAXON_ID=302021 /ORGANISM="Rhodomonas sp., Strain CCMP768" /LENGTH=75 /DNA_ID=CAMNT_0042076515 /DNA_START=20 /DNA_END=243 /DNA_ORIENTATION=+